VSGKFNDFLDFKCGYKDSRFVIIPVPMEITVSYGGGTSKGPQSILDCVEQLEPYDVELRKEAINVPVHTMDFVQADSAESYTDVIRQRVSKCVRDGKVPIVLGGEHSVSYGMFLGLAEHKKDISILHFMRTPNIHTHRS
jgi:agmatinase